MNGIQEKKVQDLVINGSGAATGGVFHNVKMSGAGKISGDVECRELKINGSGKVEGNIKADSIKTAGSSSLMGDISAQSIATNGSAKLGGHVQAGELTVNGSQSIEKSLSAKVFEVNGSSKVEGKISAEKITVNGSLKAESDCESERFIANGSIKIRGLLNADFIELNLGFESSVKEIGGETIIIKRYGQLNLFKRLFDALMPKPYHMQAELIEGDSITIETTKAAMVRGKTVAIGEKCEIDIIEYTDKIEIHPSSTVREVIKL